MHGDGVYTLKGKGRFPEILSVGACYGSLGLVWVGTYAEWSWCEPELVFDAVMLGWNWWVLEPVGAGAGGT